MASIRNARLRLIVGGALLSTLSGCYDYPAVNSLSSTAVKAVDEWQPIADDYVQNCKRAVVLEAINPAAGTDPCASFVTTQKQLGDAFTILKNYFNALGAVASDSNYALDPGIDALGSEAVALGSNKDQTDAITKLAGALANVALAGVRQHSMSELVDETDHVILVVQAVQHVVDVDYRGNIEQEGGLWMNQMINPASALHLTGTMPICAGDRISWDDPKPKNADAQQVTFQAFYTDRCNDIIGRAAAIKVFDQSAQHLVDALTMLKKNRAQLRDKAVAKDLIFPQAKALFDDAQALQKAFSATSSKKGA